jgi:hypothetical protein
METSRIELVSILGITPTNLKTNQIKDNCYRRYYQPKNFEISFFNKGKSFFWNLLFSF